MDRLKWDSEVCEGYLAALTRSIQCLNEQVRQLTNARKSILSQGVTAADKTLQEVLDRLETVLENLRETNERIEHLTDSLELSLDTFQAVEKNIAGMGMELLYMGVIRNRLGSAMVTTYSNPFTDRSITPDWLSQMAGA